MDLENPSGSNEHSESHLEVMDGSGGSDHVNAYPKLRVRIGSSGHIETDHGSESSKNSESHSEVSDGSVGNKHSAFRPDYSAAEEDDLFIPTIKLGSPSSSSPSSSSSSSPSSTASSMDDLFEVVAKRNFDPIQCEDSSDKPLKDPQPASKYHVNGASSHNSHKSEECKDDSSALMVTSSVSDVTHASLLHAIPPTQSPPFQVMDDSSGLTVTSPVSDVTDASMLHAIPPTQSPPLQVMDDSSGLTITSPVSDATHASLLHTIPPTQSPPLQVMERPGGYDPFRIPASVFETNKGATPVDWSAASNESLFSIHVGNNSFSRDHVILLGDWGKSGEITCESTMFSPPPPIEMVDPDNHPRLPDVETNKQTHGVEKSGANGVLDTTIKDSMEYQNERAKPNEVVFWKSSISNHSNGSGDSFNSFAFPIKKKTHAWPLRYCSNCSWAFCYDWNCGRKGCHCLTWPSCFCSSCSRAFCYDWNCSRKGCRCCCYFRRPCCISSCSRAFCYDWNCGRKGCCCCCCCYSAVLADGLRSGSLKASIEQEQHLQSQSPSPLPAPASRKKKSTCCRWFHCFSCCSWSCSCHHCCCCRKSLCC